jgi:outer membrane protein
VGVYNFFRMIKITMIKKNLWIGFSLLVGCVQGQENWSLQKCIQTSWANNIAIQQAELGYSQSILTAKQAQYSIYPTLNATVQEGFNAGRSIDLTSYQFVNQFMHSTALSVGGNWLVYNGGQIKNSIAQTKLSKEASYQEVEQSKNTLGLSIAQSYLTVLLSEEQVLVLGAQLKATQKQLDRIMKLINAGTLAENSKYDLEAQIARDEQNIVNAENAVLSAYLGLKTLMNYNLAADIRVEKIDLEALPAYENISSKQIYEEALQRQPNYKAAQYRQQAAATGVLVAKGGLKPSISLYLNVATNYSSTGQRFTGDTITVFQNLNGNINGSPFQLSIPQNIGTRENSPYFYQLGTNFRQSFGVNVNMPIFNGYQTRIRIQQAELSVKSAQLSINQIQNQLQNDINQSVINLQSAQRRLAASEKTLKSTEIALENSTKRYELGLINSFELVSVQNSLVAAKSNVLQARYDLLFRTKILDFYRGIAL